MKKKANGLPHLRPQMRVAVCEKKRKKFFVSKIERKKVMQKTIELTSSGDSNRVLERARVGLYRVSRRSFSGLGSRVTHQLLLPNWSRKEDGFGLLSESLDWMMARVFGSFCFFLFCLLLIFFLHKLTLTFLLGCYFTVSVVSLGCFSIRIRMVFDREVDLDLFLSRTSSIIL